MTLLWGFSCFMELAVAVDVDIDVDSGGGDCLGVEVRRGISSY